MIELLDATPADYADVLRLNDEAVPSVNRLSPEALAALHEQAFAFRLARSPAGLAGFVLALPDSAEYESVNFRWFQVRYARFVYVDRIVVDARQRGAGVGWRLYAELEERARPHARLLACEVNLRPPNPVSMAFHERFGFQGAGEQDTEGGAKRVRLMIKRLRDAGG